MSMDFDDYMEYRERKAQSTLDEFEVIEEEPKKELTAKESFALGLMRMPNHWNELEKPLLVLEKAKVNVFVASLGYKGYWLIDLGVYACSLCNKDGSKHKLHNVKYIGHICKECSKTYKKEINEIFESARFFNEKNSNK